MYTQNLLWKGMEIGMVTEETEEGEEEVVMEIKEEVVGGIKVEEAGLSQMILELEGNVHFSKTSSTY